MKLILGGAAILALSAVASVTVIAMAHRAATTDKATASSQTPSAASSASSTATVTAKARGTTVAVLDFDLRVPRLDVSSSAISDIISAQLASQSGAVAVDRTDLQKILTEQGLDLHGLVDEGSAAKVGKLVGARIIVVGKGFVLGDTTVFTAKLIGTETGLVETVMVRGDASAKISGLVQQLADVVSEKFTTRGKALLPAAAPAAPDPVIALKERLSHLRLPVVAVSVYEEHLRPTPVRVVDPAVETEIKALLKQCGVPIADLPGNDLTGGTGALSTASAADIPPGVVLLIAGKAFSESSGAVGELRTCRARAEINVIRRRDRTVVLSDSSTTQAVDLAEHIAGKSALQSVGHELGVHVLKYLAETCEPVTSVERAP